MSELHKFLFEGLPVRGVLVRLTDSWQTVLAKRAANAETGAYPPAVRALLGEMTAAAVLMQANIKFNGALVLQMMGEGPLKLAVVEVQSDMRFRSTAKTIGEVTEGMGLADMANQRNLGRCAITLDPSIADAYFQMGKSMNALGKKEGAKSYLLKSADIYLAQGKTADYQSAMKLVAALTK